MEAGWYRVTAAGNGCVHLPASASGGEYLIGALSTSENPAQLSAVSLRGTPGDATVLAAAATATIAATDGSARPGAGTEMMAALGVGPLPPRPEGALDSGAASGLVQLASDPPGWRLVPGQMPDSVRPDWERHNEIMTEGMELVRRLGPPTGDYTETPLSRARAVAATDTFSFYAGGTSCTDRSLVRTVVRYVGSHALWLEDVENPSDGFSESELAQLDSFYATYAAPVHDGYFGQLTDIGGLGRFVILMTKEANRQDVRDKSFLGGWVWPADLLARSACATSNEGEIFYGRVPDPDGVIGNAWTKQQTFDYYPSLLAHEVTHIVQSGYSVHGSAQYESWELEGGATLAEQLVAYRLFGHGSGQELGWNASNASHQNHSWYGSAWVMDMARFFGWNSDGNGGGRVSSAPEECTWVGRPGEGNAGPCKGAFRAVYGVPSMVYRYAMDRWGSDYPGGERALMRRLTQSPTQGFASLVDVSPEGAWPPEQVLADFYITLWADLAGMAPSGMSTWNLNDIFKNLRENASLQPYTSSSRAPSLTGRRVRAGSSLYFHWTPTGALQPTSIKVASPGGGRTPSEVSVWALRIR